MNKPLLLAGILTLTAALTSCGGVAPQRIYTEKDPPPMHFGPHTPPNPTDVNIFVVAGNLIVVDQEPIRPPVGDPVVIFFSLDDQGGRYAFPPDTAPATMRGIIIKEAAGVCNFQTKVQFKCKYPRPSAGTLYHYTVNVQDSSGGQPIPSLDPSIMN